VLARNEVDRDYAYNRALFKRVAQGWYQFNPKLAVRRRQGEEEIWMPVYAALNLPLINEFSRQNDWRLAGRHPEAIDSYLTLAGLPQRSLPIATERARAQEQKRLAEARALQAQRAAARAAERAAAAERLARWGSAEAKRIELERVRREIEARKKG
jgi:hypothetical protein